MSSIFKAGTRLEARGTLTNRSCGVQEGARGNITFVDQRGVSIYIERGQPGGGWIEAICQPGTIGLNFDVHEYDLNAAYVSHAHHAARYPEDFLGSR